jgi:uncharacterized protein
LTDRFTLPINPDVIRQIDEWRRRQADLPSRSEAVRRMIDYCLKNVPEIPP